MLGRRLREEEKLPLGDESGRGGGPIAPEIGLDGVREEELEVGGGRCDEEDGGLEVGFGELDEDSRAPAMPLRSGAMVTLALYRVVVSRRRLSSGLVRCTLTVALIVIHGTC